MQAEKQQPWRIYVHAKAKNFDFKLKATKILPTWMLYRFSLMLQLHQLLLKVKSESGSSMLMQQKRTLKSKFLHALEKIRAPRAKNRSIAAKNTSKFRNAEFKFLVNQLRLFVCEEPICIGSLVVGILAFLSQSISEKDRKGIIIHTSIIFLFLALFLKRFITRKTFNLLVIIIAATVACSITFDLNDLLNYDKDCVSEYVWKAWNYAVSSGCLSEFSQVIFSRFSQYMGVQRRAI